MAADAYLKTAASNLQQAASAVKQDADHIRADAANFRQQAEHDLTTMQSELAVRKLEMERNRGEPQAIALGVMVQKLQSDIDRTKQALDQKVAEAERAARSKEGAVQNLQNQAGQLERQAADPALR